MMVIDYGCMYTNLIFDLCWRLGLEGTMHSSDDAQAYRTLDYVDKYSPAAKQAMLDIAGNKRDAEILTEIVKRIHE